LRDKNLNPLLHFTVESAGHFGDKFGRKKTFAFSIFMMAAATFCIGLVPPYASIGILAPILLTILRIVQGLSVGGEIPGAIAYVSESIPQRRGFACGVIFFSLQLGIALGSLMHGMLISFFSDKELLAWGWRIPFFIGGIFGFFSYKLRRQLKESALFKAIENKTESFPLMVVLKSKLANALGGMLVVGLGASCITLLFLFTPAYLSNVLHIEAHQYVWFSTLAIFVSGLLNIIFGIVADRVSHKWLLIILSILTILLTYPIFFIYTQYFNYVLLALLFSALLVGFAFGVIPSFLAELFPTRIRYSGVAVSYNLGFALFGGLTPLIAMALIYETQLVIAPCFYLIFTALLALFAILCVKPSAKHASDVIQ